MRILRVPRALTRSVEKFRGCLSSPQFEHFQAYLLGLILGREGRNVQDIAALYPRGCDQATLNHFVTEAPWSAEKVWECGRELITRFLTRLRPRRVWLSLDDSVIPKPYGRHMEGAGYHYSTSAKRPVWGHTIVAAVVSVGKWAFAWATDLYRPKSECPRGAFRSKVDIAESYIRTYRPPAGTKVAVLADAWYFFHRLVGAAKARGFDWIFGCKSNRLIRYAGRVVTVSQLAKRLPSDEFERVTIQGRRFVVASRVVDFRGIGAAQVVFYTEVRGPSRRIRRRDLRCIATNRCDWAVRTILAGYMQRQRIENFFKDTKQHLGLGEYQLRKAQGIQRHWTLVACAHNVLLLLNRRRTRRTIGQTVLWIEDLTLELAMKWAHQRGLQKLRWKSLFRTAA